MSVRAVVRRHLPRQLGFGGVRSTFRTDSWIDGAPPRHRLGPA